MAKISQPAQQRGKLTGKQELFCNEYLIDLNATAAAKRSGYSEDTAYAIGWENLRKPEIQVRIQQLRDEIGKGFNITKERIALEYSRLAFFDIRKLHTIDGAIRSVTELTEDEAAAIAGIEIYEESSRDDSGDEFTVGTVKKIKLADKRAALDSLCKLMGFNEPDKLLVSGLKIVVTDKDE